jgi:hypothetical protein
MSKSVLTEKWEKGLAILNSLDALCEAHGVQRTTLHCKQLERDEILDF